MNHFPNKASKSAFLSWQHIVKGGVSQLVSDEEFPSSCHFFFSFSSSFFFFMALAPCKATKSQNDDLTQFLSVNSPPPSLWPVVGLIQGMA